MTRTAKREAVPLTLNAAQQAVADAEQTLQTLEARLATGDTGVTQADYQDAQVTLQFARARLAGAERVEQARKAVEHDARIAELETRLQKIGAMAGPIEELGAAAAAAMDRYGAAIAAQRVAIRSLQDEITGVFNLVHDPRIDTLPQGGGVKIGTTHVRPVPLQRSIAALAMNVVQNHAGREPISLDNPPD